MGASSLAEEDGCPSVEEIASILSYANRLARESREWEAIRDSIREVALNARTVYLVHDRAGVPMPSHVSTVMRRLLGALRKGDLPAAASIVHDSIPRLRRTATIYAAFYRLLLLAVIVPSLGGLLVSSYLVLTAPSAIDTLLALTSAGLLASTLISPLRYAVYPVLAASLILALIYVHSGPSGVSGGVLLYSAILASSVILAGALRSGVQPNDPKLA